MAGKDGIAKEGSKAEDVACVWCDKGTLSADSCDGEFDARTGIPGPYFVKVQCSKCGVEFSLIGFKGEAGIAKALKPIRELIELRKAMIEFAKTVELAAAMAKNS